MLKSDVRFQMDLDKLADFLKSGLGFLFSVFEVGHRIRMTVTCADKDNKVFRDAAYASSFVFPVVEAQREARTKTK